MEQTTEAHRLLDFLSTRGITSAKELTDAGFNRVTITRLVRQGLILRAGRGIYRLASTSPSEWQDLAELSKQSKFAVVALISALAFHDIGTQRPGQIWIALPPGAWKPTTSIPLRVTRFTEPYYSAGIEEHRIAGTKVKVYSAAKTVADCFKARSKVGYDVAVEALRDGWRLRKFTMDELMKFAKLDHVEKVMRPYIEAIVA